MAICLLLIYKFAEKRVNSFEEMQNNVKYPRMNETLGGGGGGVVLPLREELSQSRRQSPCTFEDMFQLLLHSDSRFVIPN